MSVILMEWTSERRNKPKKDMLIIMLSRKARNPLMDYGSSWYLSSK